MGHPKKKGGGGKMQPYLEKGQGGDSGEYLNTDYNKAKNKSIDELKIEQAQEMPNRDLKPEFAYGFANKERKYTKDHIAHAKGMRFKNQDDYERAACDFFNSNIGELYYSNRRGRFYRYDEKRKWMCVSSGGVIHTFVKYNRNKFNNIIRDDKLWKIK